MQRRPTTYFKTGQIDCCSLLEFEKSLKLARQLDRDLDGTFPKSWKHNPMTV